MVKIKIKVSNEKEGKSILKRVYNADRSAVYNSDYMSVFGDVMTARIFGGSVVISSNYYSSNTLDKMFNE